MSFGDRPSSKFVRDQEAITQWKDRYETLLKASKTVLEERDGLVKKAADLLVEREEWIAKHANLQAKLVETLEFAIAFALSVQQQVSAAASLVSAFRDALDRKAKGDE